MIHTDKLLLPMMAVTTLSLIQHNKWLKTLTSRKRFTIHCTVSHLIQIFNLFSFIDPPWKIFTGNTAVQRKNK